MTERIDAVNVVIHHNDPDGYLSAHIVKYYNNIKGVKTFFVEANYGFFDIGKKARDFFDANPSHLQTLFVVDFSIGYEDLSIAMSTKDPDTYRRFIWIDHHPTAIGTRDNPGDGYSAFKRFSEENPKNDCRMVCPKLDNPDDMSSGCELTWEFVAGSMESMPEIIRLVGIYDGWKKDHPEFTTRATPFHIGIAAMDLDPNKYIINFPILPGEPAPFFTYQLWNEKEYRPIMVEDIIYDGKVILGSDERRWAIARKSYGWKLTLPNGWRAFCMFSNDFGSMQFGEDLERHDICLAIRRLPKTKQWSLGAYSDKEHVDCGAWCAEIQPGDEVKGTKGGGGHKGAAGCRVQYIQDYLVQS
jgi:hypothetical protein